MARSSQFALFVCAVAAVQLTQAAGSLNEEFVKAQHANKAALREYTWKSRTELRRDGEVKNVVLEQVRYDFDGLLQKTRIGGESSAPAGRGRRGGPVRNAIVAKKTEAFKDMMQDLAGLVASYANLPADKLQTFARQAGVSKDGAEHGTIRIAGRGVLQADDALIVWVDPRNYVVRRVEITTSYETHPVFAVADYRTLENGPTYQARSVLRYPHEEIELTTETFDYQRAR